jgi:hypothetical protein
MATSTRLVTGLDTGDGDGVRLLPDLRAQYAAVRRFSHFLCEPLVTEDYVIQSMPDVSPAKWHLAHTTWFFETFVLKPGLPGYAPFEPLHEFLFNSYYNSVGKQFPRPHRGLLSRPTVEQVYQYRAHVDEHMLRLLDDTDRVESDGRMQQVIAIGLQHEQQHQELIVTDIMFSASILFIPFIVLRRWRSTRRFQRCVGMRRRRGCTGSGTRVIHLPMTTKAPDIKSICNPLNSRLGW